MNPLEQRYAAQLQESGGDDAAELLAAALAGGLDHAGITAAAARLGPHRAAAAAASAIETIAELAGMLVVTEAERESLTASARQAEARQRSREQNRLAWENSAAAFRRAGHQPPRVIVPEGWM
ncbi:hypothetical protein BJF78_24785 [Pseudonocardia sp. CNS-139]|nr:hypothetical protein BJF78_24785 [Pseudonocardia sp. CNS-139]